MTSQSVSGGEGRGVDEHFDVIVIGAGPAGSASAGLLAQAGHRVLVLEKDAFPRFHIGESLLPAGLSVLRRLGVDERDAVFLYKRGAEFVCEDSGRSRVFAFDESLPSEDRHAWHVERARFDTLLRDAAVRHGADVRHGETVRDAGVDDDLAWVETRTARFTARYLVDASGQSRLLARRNGSAVPYDCFGNSAVFTHFTDLGDAAVGELEPHNDIRVVLRPEGWGWVIPLSGRRLSVGLVSSGKVDSAELESFVSGPLVTRLTAGATRGETRVIGNYSYRNERPAGRRFAAVGDAACFLDPVFSSGVTLALRGAESLADTLAPALADGREADPDLLADHLASMDRAFRTFAALIGRFYNRSFAERLFLGDVDGMPMKSGVISALAGDVWRTGNEFQDMLLRARRSPVRRQQVG